MRISCRYCIALLAVFTVAAGGLASASSMIDPSTIGVGARPLGMGKAFVALADDSNAIFLNPSGLTQLKTFDFTSMRASLIGDINYTVIGAAVPLPAGYFGAGFITSGISAIPLTRWTTVNGVSRPETYSSVDYSSSVFLLSYANRLSAFFRSEKLKNVSLGATLKYFLQDFSQSTGDLAGASGSGLDLDLGLKLKACRWLDLGVSASNIIPYSMGGRFIWKKNGIAEGIPAYLKGGLALKVFGADGLRDLSGWDLLVLFDAEKNMTNDVQPVLLHTGLEWMTNKYLALRAGLDQQMSASSGMMGVETNMTFGVGIKMSPVSFDYAYHKYGELSENTTHYFSIGFSPQPAAQRPKAPEEKKITAVPSEEVDEQAGSIEAELRRFSDVPRSYWAERPIRYLATLGVLQGFPDGTFQPERDITKAELVYILMKLYYPGSDYAALKLTSFPDVPSDYWASPQIFAAKSSGLISGGTDGMFGPDNRVTRAEAVKMIVEFSGMTKEATAAGTRFSDMPASYWAAPYVNAAQDAGLINFIYSANFEPQKYLTRAELAQILSKTEICSEMIEECRRTYGL